MNPTVFFEYAVIFAKQFGKLHLTIEVLQRWSVLYGYYSDSTCTFKYNWYVNI